MAAAPSGSLILTSDGSSELVLRDPTALEPYGLLRVQLGGEHVGALNDPGVAGPCPAWRRWT
jgi:glutamine cyclotransferase